MESSGQGNVLNITTIVIVIVLIVALYYLYNFLYAGSITRYDVVKGPRNAVKTGTNSAIITKSDQLPPLYEGGEYSVSFWVYINDYNYRRNMNKHILSLGGSGSTNSAFDTLRVYLGAFKNTLSVRVHSHETGQAGGAGAQPLGNSLPRTDYSSSGVFDAIQPIADDNRFPSCDITTIDLQRWINITVVLNGRTTDVYMDGKLARSCVLPRFFKVDPSGYQLSLLDKGGFGGYVSNVSAFGYALNPGEVYRNYMTGPGPQFTFLEWLKSLFDPKAAGSLDYPKMN